MAQLEPRTQHEDFLLASAEASKPSKRMLHLSLAVEPLVDVIGHRVLGSRTRQALEGH